MNQTTQIPTVKELRQNGVKVRVMHRRYCAYDYNLFSFKELRNEKDKFLYSGQGLDGPLRSPKGGETIVELTYPNGKNVRGVALCSLKDQFNRKVGLNMAIFRALAKLNDAATI